ncbi:MAG: hypothetical protein H0W63_05530 [Gemmatimonadaceae bacterium]|nr:hypothetical protein [Gemmatimonadaceae bacterium]
MHIRLNRITTALSAVTLIACSAGDKSNTDTTTTTSTTPAAMTTVPDSDAAAIGGTGAPKGFLARTDGPTQKLSDIKYSTAGSGWEVTTGPAHILWDPKNVASGDYTVSATFDQLGKPMHPESFGLFIGGSDLSGPNQSYLYFLVRGSGEVFAQTRKGTVLTGRLAWQKSYAAPVADSSGKATYTITMRVAGDSVRFLVNGHQAAVLPKKDIVTDGIYGVRINHNLHVQVSPIKVTKP